MTGQTTGSKVGALAVLWGEENEGDYSKSHLEGYLHANLHWMKITEREAEALMNDEEELALLQDSDTTDSTFTELLYTSEPEEDVEDDPLAAMLTALDETAAAHEEQEKLLRKDIRDAVISAGLDSYVYIDLLKSPPAVGTVYFLPNS